MGGRPGTPERETDEGAFRVHPGTHIDHVHLRVADVRASMAFYGGVLGFEAKEGGSDGTVHLGVHGGGATLVVLAEAGSRGDDGRQRRAMLYHYALRLPTRAYLASAYGQLVKHGAEFSYEGSADHGVSESIYIRDPDFHGIEVTRDRDPSEWPRSGGRIQMATLPLDLGALLREAAPWAGLPPGTTIGHVHLHGSSVGASQRFYVRGLGLHTTAGLPSAIFMAADDYHHHVAVNTWLGEGIPPATTTGPGLQHFALRVPDRRGFEDLLRHLDSEGIEVRGTPEGGARTVVDPSGFHVQLVGP